MLERRHRLTSSAGFATAVRRGRRAAGRTLVLHIHPAQQATGATDGTPGTDPTDGTGGTGSSDARIGLVVSKAVGNAVIRNRVKRRLRHLLRGRVDRLPAGALVVVRALPAAATAGYAELERDLDRCLDRVLEGVRR